MARLLRYLLVSTGAGVLVLLLTPAAALAHASASTTGASTVSTVLPDGIGYYDATDGTFHLRNRALSADPSNYAYRFGPIGHIQALAGDWDGDGKDGIGYYNEDDGTFHLRNDATTPGPSDYAFKFGPVSPGHLVAIAGDWNGDGRTGIGFFSYDDGNIHLRDDARSSGPSNYVYAVEDGYDPGAGFLAGDWAGVGRDGLGVGYSECTFMCDAVPFEEVELANDARSGPVWTSRVQFGYASYQPFLAGDWDSSGRDKVTLATSPIDLCPGASSRCLEPLGPQNSTDQWQGLSGRWH